MNTIEKRIKSFKESPWLHQENDSYYAGDKDLAYAGFYSYPLESKKDNIKCYYCHKNVCNWEPGDIPWIEHKKVSPECILANLNIVESRVKLFEIGDWDTRGNKKASIQEFAEAGFFFYPYDDEDDTLMCFQCGVCLDQWEENDDPFAEHEKRNRRCPYLVLQKNIGKAAFDLFFARDSVYGAKRKIGFMEESKIRQSNIGTDLSVNQTVRGYFSGVLSKMRESFKASFNDSSFDTDE